MDPKLDYQSKSFTPVDEYVFTLSNELKALAEEELRETEEIRNHAIKALRDWTMSNPKIVKTRLDANWLLRFLRFRKFSIPMAQEAIERYLVQHEGPYGEHWMDNLDINRAYIPTLLDNGYSFVLPKRDKMGRRVVFYRFRQSDPNVASSGHDVLALQAMTFETLLQDEENQIRGIVHLGDVGGATLRHYTFFPLDYMMRIGKGAEKTLAMRHKGFHAVNAPAPLKFVGDLLLTHMSEKLRSRVRMYTTFDEIDFIDKENLPLEYGGVVPVKDMIESWRKELNARNDSHLKYKEMKVRKDMYPKSVLEGTLEALKIPLSSAELYEKTEECESGLPGSFRKLEID